MTHYRRDFFRLSEAALIGLFFVQAVRFLYGTLYAHLNSADLISHTLNLQAIANVPGVVNLADVQIELLVAAAALFAPLLSVIFSRLWFGPAIAAIIVAAGRVFMTANGGTMLGVIGAAATAGAGALYLATIAVQRQGFLPICLVCGFAGDQLIRLYGNTIDISWTAGFLTQQTILSLSLFLIAILAAVFERIGHDPNQPIQKGEISGWGAFSLAGLLYLEFTLLGLPNTLAHRAEVDYTVIAPWLIGITLLPLVPEIRDFARRFLNIFDSQYRGWVWFLITSLLLVIGFRFNGLLSAGVLIGAQLMISLSWWWVIQPAGSKFNFTTPALIFGLLLFLALTAADFLTYEYAFVRGVPEPFGTVLRAFRGSGLVVTIFASLLASFPAILARKRLPWRGGPFGFSLAALTLAVMAGVLAGSLAQPVVISPPAVPGQLRIATLNLNGGFGLYYSSDLTETANNFLESGADVILLQSVEAGRLTSYGIDQAAWLGHYLKMQVAYFPTNEALQGLAILSKAPISQVDAALLTSQGRQTGVQFVRLNIQGQALDIYNTELSPLLQGLSPLPDQEEGQKQQIKEILSFLDLHKSLSNRLILGGTFNFLPDPNADIYRALDSRGFKDKFLDYPFEKSTTLRQINDPSIIKPPRRVDYLWLYQINTQRVGVSVETARQSSHNIVLVEIDVAPLSGN